MAKYSSDEASIATYEAYRRLLLGKFHGGMYRFIGALDKFLTVIEEIAVVGEKADRLASIVAKCAEFNRIELAKLKERDALKVDKEFAAYRTELQELVEVVRSEVMLLARRGDEAAAESLNNLLEHFHAMYAKKRHWAG